MPHIKGFNALRAISVLLVIASHIGVISLLKAEGLNHFFTIFNADFGVKTFFVLSGFLITTLLMQEYTKTGQINVGYFMARRALRILPLYFLVIAFMLTLVFMGIAQGRFVAMLYSTFFSYNFISRAQAVNYLSHLWSLGVEEQFYLLWPFVFSGLFSRRIILGFFCVGIIIMCYWRIAEGYGDLATTYYPNRWTIPAIYPIMIGCIAALVSNQARPVVGGTWTCWGTLIASIALISLPLWFTNTALVQVAGAVGLAGLVLWIFHNQDKAIVSVLEWRPLAYLGTISYGLYVWQGILTGNGTYRAVPYWPLNVWLGGALTFIVAPLSFHYFEKPISNLRSRFRAGRHSRTSAPSVVHSPAE